MTRSKPPLIVTYTDYIFRLAGLSVSLNPKHKTYVKLHFYIYAFLLYPIQAFSHITHLATSRLPMVTALEVLMNLTAVTALLLWFVWVHLRERCFLKCYENISSVIIYNTDEFYCRAEGKIRKFKIIFFFLCLGIAGTVTGPALTAMFTNAELGTSLTFISPPHFPWRSDTLYGYMFTYFLQCVISLTGLTVPVSVLSFIGLYWIAIHSQYEIFNREIVQLDHLDEDEHTPPKLMLQEERNIIQHHRFISE